MVDEYYTPLTGSRLSTTPEDGSRALIYQFSRRIVG